MRIKKLALSKYESLEQFTDECNQHVAELKQTIAERDSLIAGLGQTVESLIIDRDAHKAGLEQMQESFERVIYDLNFVLSSRSWKITRPLRLFGRILEH